MGSVSRIDDLQLLDDRAGPAVIDDERQRVFVLRTNVDEVDVEPVDLGDELRQGVQLRLALAPVVLRRPVAREFLHHRERHALGLIRDGLLLGPVRGRDASTEVVQGLVRNVDVEGADVDGGLDGAAHDDRPLVTQRPERGSHLVGEELRLLPGGEVAAPVDLVEVGEVGVDRLDPAARGRPRSRRGTW